MLDIASTLLFMSIAYDMQTWAMQESCQRRPNVEIHPAGSVLGAEVHHLDIAAGVSKEDLDTVKKAFADHLVLIIKNQTLTPQQQITFTSHWGEVEPHPLGSRSDSHPPDIPGEVMVVQNNPNTNTRAVKNDVWHSDLSCMEHPPALSVLYALAVPQRLGDTMFANGYLGWESLSAGLQKMLRGLRAVHNSNIFEKAGYKESFTAYAPDVLHPLVRTHPVTGKQSLYITENFMERFEDMTVEESEPIKRFLLSWVSRPENVYRHRWSKGDLVMWDNRATLHYGVYDYGPGDSRILHRTTAAGERPV